MDPITAGAVVNLASSIFGGNNQQAELEKAIAEGGALVGANIAISGLLDTAGDDTEYLQLEY